MWQRVWGIGWMVGGGRERVAAVVVVVVVGGMCIDKGSDEYMR